ncbi:MAG: cytochrome c3 family protein [Candidatus Methylomirabilia bacterium]
MEGARVRWPARLAAVLVSVAALSGPAHAANLGFHQPVGIVDPCGLCHDTAKSNPVLRGWAGTVGGAPGTWGAKPISSLCYMCHESGGGGFAGHNMTANAYADPSHGFVVADVPAEPEGSPQGSRYRAVSGSALPYTVRLGIECTSCHNVHRATDRPFLYRATISALCDECHEGRSNSTSLTSIPGFTRAYSTHPTSQLLGDTAQANIKIVDNVSAVLKVAIPPAAGWVLGGHLGDSGGDTGVIGCQTCHAIHGPVAATPGLAKLLTIDNTTPANTATPSRLCEGCHYGGDAGEQVGSVVAQAGLSAGQWSDHPIDANANRSFYPTGVALPAAWSGAQPFYLNQVPVCSSCHDVHGGIADTPLLRGPVGAGWPALDYDDWCFSCHAAALILPAAHHSTAANMAVSQGDAIDSQLSCGDCHGPSGITDWRAHNGFWAWPAASAYSPISGAFCMACHNGANNADPTALVAPALKGQTFVTPAPYPSTHGTVRGGGSHYLGPDSGEFAGVDPKLTAWSSGYFSSYGAPNTGGGGAIAAVSAGEVICQSCHNILYNDGSANPASYGGSTSKAGWRSNLLLQPYADDPPGNANGAGAGAVGSALCTGCHDPVVGNHHPVTGYPPLVPLSGLTLRTGSGSYADQTSAPVGGGAAPGTLSYPNTNQMDCDSCHRPHRADSDSDVAAAAHGSKTSSDGRPTRHILEVDGLSHLFSDLCAECHLR